MKKQVLLTLVIALGLLSALLPLRQAARAQGNTPRDFVAPAVFQAAGPTASSIQSTVDAFRAALGQPNNGNNPGPLAEAVAARSTGTAATPPTSLRRPGNAVQRVPEHPRRPVHHTGDWAFRRLPPRAGLRAAVNALQQSDLRHHLQHLQPVAAVHPGRQQHHRSFVLRARHQWSVTQQRSVASARSSQTLTSRMGAGLARSRETVGPAR